MLESFSQLPERRGLLSWNCSTPVGGTGEPRDSFKLSGRKLRAPKVSSGCAAGCQLGEGRWRGTGRCGEKAGFASSPRTGGGRRGLAGASAPRHSRAGRFSGCRKPGAELSSCRLVRHSARGSLGQRLRLSVRTWPGPRTGVCFTGLGGACSASQEQPGERQNG